MKKNLSNIFWGVLIIGAAVLWIVSELGYLSGVGTGQILFSILWGAWIIKGLISKSSFSVFMGLAFLSIVWDKELGIEAITPWPVIGAALLLTIGFSLIFKGAGRRKWQCSNTKYGTSQAQQSYADGNHVYHMNKFSGAEKYIDSQNLKSVEIVNKAGGMEVYLDKAKAAGDTVNMKIECYAGGLEIYIPRSWRVENNVECFMGAVEGPQYAEEAVNDVTLVLSGKVKAGGVEIIRV